VKRLLQFIRDLREIVQRYREDRVVVVLKREDGVVSFQRWDRSRATWALKLPRVEARYVMPDELPAPQGWIHYELTAHDGDAFFYEEKIP
jgi:hypothetical protein